MFVRAVKTAIGSNAERPDEGGISLLYKLSSGDAQREITIPYAADKPAFVKLHPYARDMESRRGRAN